jgi:hypothetical protein
VLILDGARETVDLDLGRFPLPKLNGSRYTAEPGWVSEISIDWWGERPQPTAPKGCDPFIANLFAHTGYGVPPITYSAFGKRCIEDAFFRTIEAVPTQRYKTLNRESFSVGQRVAEGQIPEKYAAPTLLEAARRMRFNDKYTEADLREFIEIGLRDGARHPRSY